MARTLIFGTGRNAVRLLARADGGCEIRFNQRILTGNPDMAKLLRYIHSDPAADKLCDFAGVIGQPVDGMRLTITNVLQLLTRAGISPDVWGATWHEAIRPSEVLKD